MADPSDTLGSPWILHEIRVWLNLLHEMIRGWLCHPHQKKNYPKGFNIINFRTSKMTDFLDNQRPQVA
jgi:hypothetical protein